ncbi:MAG: fibronectin type III domain-containing protein [Spirochaetales bacterium]|jgi:hypothetical protein|nr:fibronectin type III domain-containing protein [Spirochaetales bacterium]
MWVFRCALIGLSALIVFSFSACSLFEPNDNPVEILVKSQALTLAWDAPAYSGTYPGSEIVSYNVFYRVHGASDWTLLSEVEADSSPSLKITGDELDFGFYDFAVSAISESGEESPLHESTDTTADPIIGWYVNWIGSL